MILRCRAVSLRDRCESDLEDHLSWNTVKTWWKLWDAPWENAPVLSDEDPRQRDERIRGKLREHLAKPIPAVRLHFEVDGPGGVHLGWTNRHRAGEDGSLIAIGIDLPDVDRGARAAGTTAFALHAAYRFRVDGCSELYSTTWSGNLPMIGLAVRVGFEECACEAGAREVRGRTYDALRFVLRQDRLWRRCPWLQEAELPGDREDQLGEPSAGSTLR